MSDQKMQYLQILQDNQVALERALGGAAQIKKGGVSGIQSVAKTNPDVILIAIDSLVRLVEHLNKEYLALNENYFELLDQLEKINNPESDPS